jgi:hypothetical protein
LQTDNETKKLVESLNKDDFNNLRNVAETAHEMQMCVAVVIEMRLDESTGRHVTIVFETEKSLECGEIEVSLICWLVNQITE